MYKRNKKKGFSLIELIVMLAIMAVATAIFIPSYLSLQQDSKMKKDIETFDSISNAFKYALGERIVQKEMEEIATDGNIQVVFTIEDDGYINFSEAELIADTTKEFNETELWLNSFISMGTEYHVETNEWWNDQIRFNLIPKTATSTAVVTYELPEGE